MRKESLMMDEGRIDVPFFDDLPDSYCARYARMAAKHIYGLDYPVANAWNMAAMTRSMESDGERLECLARKGLVKPGALIGIYTGSSIYNEDSRPYTHISLFLGTLSGKPAFLEQMVREIRCMTLDDYRLDGLAIMEIIYPITVPLKPLP